jgi:hypothetical protein
MVLSVLGIAGGTALAAYGEVHNSILGLVIMFGSEVLEATRLVMTQLLLAGHKMGPFEGLMWMVSWLSGGGGKGGWEVGGGGDVGARPYLLRLGAVECLDLNGYKKGGHVWV